MRVERGDGWELRCGRYQDVLADVEQVDAVITARFRSYATPEPNSGCWLWLQACDKDGYGKFQVTNFGPGPKQFHIRAHRFALFLAGHGWPAAVRHRCDTPACVNPDHLIGGTQKENIADMDKRGRRPRGWIAPSRRGSRHPLAVIDEATATLIKRRLREGAPQRALARELGVGPHVVFNIARGGSWGWL